MRKYIWCAFVISLACCLKVAAGGLYHFRGNVAMAEFESWDNAGVVTVVWMQVEQSRSQNPPGNGVTRDQILFEAFRYDTVNQNTFSLTATVIRNCLRECSRSTES